MHAYPIYQVLSSHVRMNHTYMISVTSFVDAPQLDLYHIMHACRALSCNSLILGAHVPPQAPLYLWPCFCATNWHVNLPDRKYGGARPCSTVMASEADGKAVHDSDCTISHIIFHNSLLISYHSCCTDGDFSLMAALAGM